MSQKKMRITHLVENLERGGLERVVIDLVLEQASLGHDVQVICLFGEGILAPELINAGIPVTACHKQRGFDQRALRAIQKLLLGHRTQILHSHNPIPHYYGVMATLFMKGVTIGNTRHGMGNAPFHLRREFFYRLSLLRTSFVAMVCERARQNFVRHGIVVPGKAKVVPNGIRLSLFKPRTADARGLLVEQLKLNAGSLRIVSVGRLNPVKDQATLLHALVHVRATIGNAVLVVIGGGQLQNELAQLAKRLGIENAVYFLGDRDDVKALLPGFDIFVLPSLTEGYSISLLEACASALPIVATDVGGNAEIVRQGVNGTLVAPRKAEAMANAIIALAGDEKLRLRMGMRGRKWVLDNGTIEIMAQRYLKLYCGETA